MKCYLFYILFLSLVLIKAQENDELIDVITRRNESNISDDEMSVEFYEYRYIQNHKPVFNLFDLMREPKLPGIADENWPYPEDEDPFSKYKRNGCKQCHCGIKPRNRIVMGSFAKRDEFPWQVLFTYKRRLHCGGALINDLFVLTAAHCKFGFEKNNLEVRFGVFKRHSHQGIYRQIAQFWIANDYNPNTILNDVAIAKLKTKVRITPIIRPICLPIPGSTYDGVLATVAGWGAVYFGGPSSEVLKKAQLPVLSNKQCRKTGYGSSIKPSQLCVGNNGRDSCSGDSGGPLITFQKNRYREIGIVSYGISCNKPNYPGIYARVTSYYRSIIQLASTGGACWCNDSVK